MHIHFEAIFCSFSVNFSLNIAWLKPIFSSFFLFRFYLLCVADLPCDRWEWNFITYNNKCVSAAFFLNIRRDCSEIKFSNLNGKENRERERDHRQKVNLILRKSSSSKHCARAQTHSNYGRREATQFPSEQKKISESHHSAKCLWCVYLCCALCACPCLCVWCE